MAIDQAERERRRKLLQAHLETENAHDLAAIMETFSNDAEMVFNLDSFKGQEAIARAHAGFGMSGSHAGAIEGLRVLADKEYFTDDEIIIEGRVVGRHVRDFAGLPPSNAEISLPFITVYRFDSAGKLASERVVMNFAAFGKPEAR
jgi:hypothetical protein